SFVLHVVASPSPGPDGIPSVDGRTRSRGTDTPGARKQERYPRLRVNVSPFPSGKILTHSRSTVLFLSPPRPRNASHPSQLPSPPAPLPFPGRGEQAKYKAAPIRPSPREGRGGRGVRASGAPNAHLRCPARGSKQGSRGRSPLPGREGGLLTPA